MSLLACVGSQRGEQWWVAVALGRRTGARRTGRNGGAATAHLRHERPLQARGEASAATAAKARRLHVRNDLLGAEEDELLGLVPVATLHGALNPPVAVVVPAERARGTHETCVRPASTGSIGRDSVHIGEDAVLVGEPTRVGAALHHRIRPCSPRERRRRAQAPGAGPEHGDFWAWCGCDRRERAVMCCPRGSTQKILKTSKKHLLFLDRGGVVALPTKTERIKQGKNESNKYLQQISARGAHQRAYSHLVSKSRSPVSSPKPILPRCVNVI